MVEVKGMSDALPGCSSCGCSEGNSLSSPWTELIYFRAAVAATFVYFCARGTRKSHGKGDQEPVTATSSFPTVPYIMLFHTVY